MRIIMTNLLYITALWALMPISYIGAIMAMRGRVEYGDKRVLGGLVLLLAFVCAGYLITIAGKGGL